MHDGGGGVVCVLECVVVGCDTGVDVVCCVEVFGRDVVEPFEAGDECAVAELLLSGAELPGAREPALDAELVFVPVPEP